MKFFSSQKRRAPARPRWAHALATACVPFTVAQAHAQTATDPHAEAPPLATLSPVEVVGRRNAGAYHADEASGAKTDLPLRELPQSVRVVTRQTIDDLGATRLDDVLDTVGGVSRQNNFGGLWDNIAIRGLPGDQNVGMATLFNGLSAGRGFNAPRDLAGVERVEFLKGPAAALYGSSEPGGTLNIVSKRPLWRAGHAAEFSLGSHDLRRLSLDSTGPVNDQFAYRLNAAVERRDSFRDHVNVQRDVVAPAFTWRLGADTVLDYRGEWLRHQTPLDRGIVAVDGRLDAVPRSRFLGEPADGGVTVRNQTHQWVLSQAWGNTWHSRVALSWRETSVNGFSTEAQALQPNGLLTRQRRFRDYRSDDLALQAELQGTLHTGPVEHELLVGAEAYRFAMDSRVLRANPTPLNPYAIDVYAPVYGQPQPVPPLNTSTLERQHNTALYVQDALKLAPQWRLMAGLRMDDYRQSTLNRRTGTTQQQDPLGTSPRVGLSWLPTPQWTVYANAGRSFRPNTGTRFDGAAFDPEHGRSLELGAKWESPDRRLGATAALFDIRKRNVLTADAANPGYSIATGEVTSRGIEFDVSGQLTAQWRLNASLAWNEVEVSRDNTLPVGSRLLNTPRVTGSLLAMHEGTWGDGLRHGVGGGVMHVGDRLGQAGDPTFILPAYTTVKLMTYLRLSPSLRLTLDVDNLFDRTYYTSSYSRLWVTPGQPRTLTAGVQARF